MAFGGESDVNKWFPTTGPITDTFNGRHPFADIPIDHLSAWHLAIVLGVEAFCIAFVFAFTYWWYNILKKRDESTHNWFRRRSKVQELRRNEDLKRASVTSANTLINSGKSTSQPENEKKLE
ncbi:hypothetical protein DL96DRAFT_1711325 [Flagelloscypha sp. PMI_526]|nr:hypothetical protein DL96DRAFT_1711325 [Flagelloscypha sp. PMI_526]